MPDPGCRKNSDAARAQVVLVVVGLACRCSTTARRAARDGSRRSARRRCLSGSASVQLQPSSATCSASCRCRSRHSRSRRYETKCARQRSTSCRCDSFVASASAKNCHSAISAQEIRALVAKAQMRLIGRLLLFQRALARIGHRQRARDHQHLGEAAAVSRGEDHAADARIDRQSRELAAERRQRLRCVDRAELLQQLIAVGDRARAGRLEKRKGVDRRRDRAQPCAGSRRRATSAGSPARCIAAARRSPSSS